MRDKKSNSRQRGSANTQDILGLAPQNGRINPRWRSQYHQLMEVRDHVLRRKGHFVAAAKEEHPIYSIHMADAATDQYDLDFAISMISADQDAIYEIDQAINRIKTGSYGVCELTGEPIEPERLQAIPWTRYSAQAQRELERSGEASRVKLAKRESLLQPQTADSDDEEESE